MGRQVEFVAAKSGFIELIWAMLGAKPFACGIELQMGCRVLTSLLSNSITWHLCPRQHGFDWVSGSFSPGPDVSAPLPSVRAHCFYHLEFCWKQPDMLSIGRCLQGSLQTKASLLRRSNLDAMHRHVHKSTQNTRRRHVSFQVATSFRPQKFVGVSRYLIVLLLCFILSE